MNSFRQKLVFCSLLIAAMAIFSLALADEEDVTAQDLGVVTPNILPDSRFYFLKEWQRKLKLAFAFNPVKKAEVQQKINNEKLFELDVLAQKTQNSAILKKATENYRLGLEKLANQVEKIKTTAETNPEVQKFLDKFVNQSTLQQKILDKLSEKVPSQVMQKIEEARQNHLEKFNQVMTKLENRTEKQLEIIEGLKQQVQTGTQGTQQVIEKAKEKIIEKINQVSKESGCPSWTKPAADFCPEGRIVVSKDANGCFLAPECVITGNTTNKRVGGQMCITLWKPVCGADNKTYSNDCFAKAAGVAAVSEGACEKQEENKYLKCGGIQGIVCPKGYYCKYENDYPDAQGKCVSEKEKCKTLWWFDNDHKFCQQSDWCGAYMYLGLQTFKMKQDCEKALAE